MNNFRCLRWTSEYLPSKITLHGMYCFFSTTARAGCYSFVGVSLLKSTRSYSHGCQRRSFTHSSSYSRGRNGGSAADPSDPTLPERFRAVMRQMPHPVVIITTLDCPPLIATSRKPPSSSCSSTIPPLPPPPHWTSSDVLDSKSSSTGADQLRPIPRAMTVSSFTSLSLRPRERVLFNIALPSRTYHAIFSSGRFNAHVLAGDAHGARLADLFAKGYGGLGLGGGGAGPEREAGLGVLAGLAGCGVEVSGKHEWDAEWDSVATAREPDSGGGGGDGGGGRKKYTAPLLRGRGVMHVLKCDLYTPPYLDNRPPLLSPNTGGEEAPRGDDHDNFAIMLGEVTEIVPGDDAAAVGGAGDIALAYADGAYRMPGKQVLKHEVVLPPER